MNSFDTTMLETRARYLKHIRMADKYHFWWSLFDRLSFAVSLVGFISSSTLLLIDILYEPLVSFPVWMFLVLLWFVPQFLMEVAIQVCRKHMYKHQNLASLNARILEDYGISPAVY